MQTNFQLAANPRIKEVSEGVSCLEFVEFTATRHGEIRLWTLEGNSVDSLIEVVEDAQYYISELLNGKRVTFPKVYDSTQLNHLGFRMAPTEVRPRVALLA